MEFVLAGIIFILAVVLWFVWSNDAVQAGENPDWAPTFALVIGAIISVAILLFC
jgi:hypothetical protein